MTTKKSTFAQIRSRVPIDVALAYYGITLNQSGSRLNGVCPIHKGSNTRAFAVSADRKAWHCFGDCNNGGSVLDLIMGMDSVELKEAANILTERHKCLLFDCSPH